MQMGKITREEMEKELISTGVSSEAVEGIIEVLSLKSLSKLEGLPTIVYILGGFFLSMGIHLSYSISILFELSLKYVFVQMILLNPPPLNQLTVCSRCRYKLSDSLD